MITQNFQWNSKELKVGRSKTVQKTITESDTLAFGRGALTELLATSSLTALMVEAAVTNVDPLLPEGYVTVGKSTMVSYQNPTIIGMTVTVVARSRRSTRTGSFSRSRPSTNWARLPAESTSGSLSTPPRSWIKPTGDATP